MSNLVEFITYTKGVEYLIAISFLLVFIWFWRFARGGELVTVRAEERVAVGIPKRIEDVIGGFLLPRDVYYHQGHTWVRPESGDVVAVGIDDFAQKLLGKIDGADLPQVGASIKQGDRGISLIVDDRSVDLLSPVDGMVVAVNNRVLESPDAINRDPYGEGWLFKVQVPRMKANMTGLLSGNLAKKWMDEVAERLMARVAPAAGTVALDAGPAAAGIARQIAGDDWVDLASEFLMTKA